MPWFDKIVSAFSSEKRDVSEIKKKVQIGEEKIPDADLKIYIEDINARVKTMNKELKNVYKHYNISFTGFKGFDLAHQALLQSLNKGKEEANNVLIKLESEINLEQRRHLALIRIAVTTDGRKVMDHIMRDPNVRERYCSIFGLRDAMIQENASGTYYKLWSEIHKLAEYIIMQKNKVYH